MIWRIPETETKLRALRVVLLWAQSLHFERCSFVTITATEKKYTCIFSSITPSYILEMVQTKEDVLSSWWTEKMKWLITRKSFHALMRITGDEIVLRDIQMAALSSLDGKIYMGGRIRPSSHLWGRHHH